MAEALAAAGLPVVLSPAENTPDTSMSALLTASPFDIQDPLIVSVTTRLQQLELAVAQERAERQALEEKGLEQDENLRSFIEGADKERADFLHERRMREMETQEIQRQLTSESNAKWKVNQQLQSSTSTTAELSWKLNTLMEQVAQNAIAALPTEPAQEAILAQDAEELA